eukprot:15342726-Ditylum_brightwellii.AAC.1
MEGKKQQQDKCVDITLPGPDVKVASRLCMGGPCKQVAENPVNTVLLVTTGYEEEVHLNMVPDADEFSWVGCGDKGEDRHGNAGGGCATVAGELGVGYGDQAWAIYAKAGVDRKNMWYKALQPAQRVVQNEAPSIKEEQEEEKEEESTVPFIATFFKCPCDLHVLWHKYKFGIGGQKPTKYFIPSEQGK